MSFGLRNAAQTFQRFMDEILERHGLLLCLPRRHPCLHSPEEHDQHLRSLFTQLKIFGILLNPSKCVFRAPVISFLGYKISSLGSQPLPERVAEFQACPPASTVSQLRRFLVMLNFYRRFLPHVASNQAPLHDVLSDPRVKGSHHITWTPALHTAFDECKASLCRRRQDFNTASLQWTASPAGRKPFPSPTSPQRRYHVPRSPVGYPVPVARNK